MYLSSRNRAKGNSLTMNSFAFLMLKTIFASISRVLLFSAWLYVTNNGEFSSMKTFVGYYLTVLVLVIFYFFFNKVRPSCSSTYWIGLIFISLWTFNPSFFSEILLDAMSSVLSYNDLDLGPVLEEGIKGKQEMKKDEPLHEATFMKQFFYCLLMIIMNVWYVSCICIYLFSMYVPIEIFQIFFQLISVHSNELLWHHRDQRFKWKTPFLDAVSSSGDPSHWLGFLLPVLDMQHHILQSPPLKSWVQSWEIKSQVFHLFLGEEGQIPRLPI